MRSQKDYSISYGVTESRDQVLSLEAPPTVRELLRLPLMRAVCISGCALSFVGSAFDVVFVLFCYSSVKMGGLGFSVNLLFLIANEVIPDIILCRFLRSVMLWQSQASYRLYSRLSSCQ